MAFSTNLCSGPLSPAACSKTGSDVGGIKVIPQYASPFAGLSTVHQ